MKLALLLFLALATSELLVELKSDTLQLDAQSASFPVVITFTNDYATPVTVLKWNTPLDDASSTLRADMFEILHTSGVQATYTGIIMKRIPTLSDFITLNPGQSTTVELDLFKGYWFPMSGDYKIRVATVFKLQEASFEPEAVMETYSTFVEQYMESNLIGVDVLAVTPAPIWPAPLQTNLTGPAPSSNCNADRTAQINTAGANAITASARGYNYLPSTCSSTLRSYTEWFGVCDTSRYNKVRTSLSAINTGLKGSYPVDCAGSECTANTYAYVYPAQRTHTVYVCGYFWRVTSANCVMDSQPGTLIHEMGHFNDVASLNDVTYGMASCRKLAVDAPNQAVTNADNYCFYTDSCP